VFASAGNSGSSIYEYPAAFDGVISVGSVAYNNQKSNFNTRNERVAIFAPGEGYPLPSPLSEQNIVRVDGTSFSCPFAAGLAALYIQEKRISLGNPSWRPTRADIVRDLPELLGTQGMSYPAPGLSPVDLFSGDTVETIAYVGVALVGVAIFALLATRFIK
jgi:subtilisin family serine protease